LLVKEGIYGAYCTCKDEEDIYPIRRIMNQFKSLWYLNPSLYKGRSGGVMSSHYLSCPLLVKEGIGK
ncbi:MAG: hypothetical protein HGA78_09150, partial [Nitrospirales bacterium]|nr:hypothetical protein [Nitrospirales bacterium]